MTDKLVRVSRSAIGGIVTYRAEGSRTMEESSIKKLSEKLPRGTHIVHGYGLYPSDIKELAKRHEILPPSYDV